MCKLDDDAKKYKQAKKDVEQTKKELDAARRKHLSALDYLKDVEREMNLDRNYD